MNKFILKILHLGLLVGILLAVFRVSAQTPQIQFDLANLRKTHPDFTVAYDRIKIQSAWELINSKLIPLQEVIIGIIEDGIEKAHDEFLGVNLGRTPPELFIDTTGHGTSVSGIIGANNVSFAQALPADSPQMNGILSGVKGLNYVLGLRALESTPWEFEAQLNDLIDTGNAQTINLSLGFVRTAALSAVQKPFAAELGAADEKDFKEWSDFFNDYIAKHPNVIFSIAAGNENVDVKDAAPANATSPNAIVVGATDVSDSDATKESRAIFKKQNTDIIQASNFGAGVIAAPGTNVYAPATTTLPATLGFEDYRQPNHPMGFFSGTSASAPMVTGVAGLIKAIRPQLPPSLIKLVLTLTSDPIVTDQPLGRACFTQSSNVEGFNGCRLNARRAVKLTLTDRGVILRQFDSPVQGNGRGITFDGTNLYYTNRDDTRIFKINATGQLLQAITPLPFIFPSALAWDGSTLWAAASQGRFFTIDIQTGSTTPRFTFSYPSTDTCYNQPPGFTDGFEFDPSTSTFWISDDAGRTIYNISKTGQTIDSFSIAPECNSGLAVTPSRIWAILYDQPNPDHTFRSGRFTNFSKSGQELSPGFFMDARLNEDAAFDSLTFAPNCALWTIQNFLPSLPAKITAFKVPCE